MATGVGKNSNINIEGSDISGKQGTTLIADNQVNIKAIEENHQERSTNKSSGFNAGVGIKVSNGAVAGATLGGNYGKGYGNGDETTYVASHVGDSQSKTVIQAGGDANIIGSQVKGKRVELNAENLNIESLQDKSRYYGKQMNASGSVTVGYGASVGGSFNKSKINADHASINEQAGVYAGDEGYDINVNKHTDLKGALITSTQKAEADGKNHFSTDSITHSDIENRSNYSGSSFGVSGSVSANFETPFGKNGAAQSTKQATDKDGNLLYTDKNGNTTVNSKGVDGQENTKKLAEGKESLQFSYGMGYGKDSDSQSSTTKSGINTQNIIIKDEAEQLKRTGKTVQEEIAAIKTDITTESAPSQSGKLENRFNTDDVQKELDFQREVTEKFGPNVVEAGSLLANKFGEEAKAKRHEAAIALEEAEKAKAENNNETNQALVKQARDNFETASREAKEWETGGSQRLIIDSALNVISTALAGRPAAEVVASGLSPAVNNQIKKATTDAKGNVNTALNLTAHALWGAVEAYAGNRNVAAGAAGAAGGEVAAHFLASTLYDKSPEKLSEEEKRTVSSLSQVAAGIAGGSLSDSSDGAIIAAKTAKDSVENNALTPETVWDVANLTIGGASLAYNIEEGNYGMAVLDGVGLLYDGFATVMPFLLAGASSGLKAYRAGNSVKQSVAIGSDVAKTANAAHQAAKNSQNLVGNARAVGSKIHRDTGRRIGEVSGKPSKLSNNANSYFISANKATGKQPDLSWKGTNTWGDLTTSGQWNSHVKKYESSFGSTSIPIIYERGNGVINLPKMKSGAGTIINVPGGAYEYYQGDK